jgi:hypothetical protein
MVTIDKGSPSSFGEWSLSVWWAAMWQKPTHVFINSSVYNKIPIAGLCWTDVTALDQIEYEKELIQAHNNALSRLSQHYGEQPADSTTLSSSSSSSSSSGTMASSLVSLSVSTSSRALVPQSSSISLATSLVPTLAASTPIVNGYDIVASRSYNTNELRALTKAEMKQTMTASQLLFPREAKKSILELDSTDDTTATPSSGKDGSSDKYMSGSRIQAVSMNDELERLLGYSRHEYVTTNLFVVRLAKV